MSICHAARPRIGRRGLPASAGILGRQPAIDPARADQGCAGGLAPLRPTMPRTGKPFSVRMSNCGPLGWVSDQAGGYRYQADHPLTGKPWPSMPELLLEVWRQVADYPLPPEACLINYYAPGAKMGSHRDADEEDARAPVVSVSLGDDAAFHIGGLVRAGTQGANCLAVRGRGGARRRCTHGLPRHRPRPPGHLAAAGGRRANKPDASARAGIGGRAVTRGAGRLASSAPRPVLVQGGRPAGSGLSPTRGLRYLPVIAPSIDRQTSKVPP